MRLLLIGSNKKDIGNLVQAFNKFYIIDVASNAAKSIFLSECNSYDSIILDSVIDGMGALELCRMMRNLKIDSPLVLLSEDRNKENRVMSYDCGADAVLFKPVGVDEVVAQVNVLTRRNGNYKNCCNILKSGDLALDMKNKKFFVKEMPIDLRRKEYDLLEYLMINRGRILSKEKILEHVWEKGLDVFSNTVEVHVRNIRIRFKERFGVCVIRTHRGFGYEIET